MKQRPRRAEREIARLLSDIFISHGLEPVERIPVLGRTGPDITINSFGLVVDVKSRIEIPKSYVPKEGVVEDGELIACTVSDFGNFANPVLIHPSVTVRRYHAHMDEWTRQYQRNGITAIILHRPKMPFGKARVVISKSDLERFNTRWTTQLQSSQVTEYPQSQPSVALKP